MTRLETVSNTVQVSTYDSYVLGGSIPSGFAGESNMAQKGANQYSSSILVVAMIIGAVMVINAETTASV